MNTREGFTITTTITTRFPPARGGGEKLESSNDDDTLRDGRKGYPQQVCCGKKWETVKTIIKMKM